MRPILGASNIYSPRRLRPPSRSSFLPEGREESRAFTDLLRNKSTITGDFDWQMDAPRRIHGAKERSRPRDTKRRVYISRSIYRQRFSTRGREIWQRCVRENACRKIASKILKMHVHNRKNNLFFYRHLYIFDREINMINETINQFLR